MSNVEQLFTRLGSEIDLGRSKIKPYEGFIFLCGGPTDIQSPEPVSIRDSICRELAKDAKIYQRISIAENFKSWNQDSVYKDLLEFEKHLAELSSLIVVVLESAGSIAELGLFSVIEEFQKKLLIFIDSSHYKEDSFIKYGPISFLENAHNNMASCHIWLKSVGSGAKKSFDSDAAQSITSDLVEEIHGRLKKVGKEMLFKKDEWLHCALLICDVLNLMSALTIREIKDFLGKINIHKTESEIRQIIFMLKLVGMITMEPKGEQRFYVAIKNDLFLSLQLASIEFDLDRFRSDVLSAYSNGDRKRFKVIQSVRAANGN